MKSKFVNYLLVTIFLISLSGCSDKSDDTIQIGFVAGLSGKYSSLGTSIRDGFIMAFDEIDNKIDGKNIVIIQKDDKQNEIEAKKIIDSFIANNIKLVVGNATSSMTAITFPIVNKHKDMLLISATASSGDFTKIDDNFIRIQVEHSAKRYKALNKYITLHNYKNIIMIYDSKNIKYAQGYEQFFQNMIVKNGGKKFVGKIDLNKPYKEIEELLKSTNHDMILIVGNSVDSANIIQYLRFNNINSKILCSGWAKTLDFISNGGQAIEGTLFATGYDDNSKDKSFVEFKERFISKYSKIPSVFSAQGYELAQILIENLKDSSNISTLKDRILKTQKYDGLQGDIIFDKYGDVFREYFMMEVKNKEFIKI